VAAPADAGEAAAALAQVLDSEDAVVLALPGAALATAEWPADHAYLPGSGRWLARGEAATLVCESRSAAAALEAGAALRALGVEVGVLHCTSLHPLPLAELERAAERAPLVVCSATDAEGGLGAAVLRQLAGLLGARSSAIGPDPGQGPLRCEAIVARARALLALSLPA
jgi:transketolase